MTPLAHKRRIKDELYEYVARIGKAVASPKRLEILELLSQSEKSVEQLAAELSIDIRLTSAHLRTLREAHLVTSQKHGKYVVYRLTGDDVSALWVNLRQVAEEHLTGFSLALSQIASDPSKLAAIDRQSLLARAEQGEIVVLDVRPRAEYEHAHLPFARSMPITEILERLAELPQDKEIVAYCRGPFCLFSEQAKQILIQHGFRASQLLDGINEWQAAGMPLAPG